MLNRLETFKGVFICALGVLLLVIIGLTNVQAQVGTATILGTVTDSTAAVVAGATVVLKNTGTNVSQTIITNAQGRYIATTLPIGTYSVEADKTGFQKVLHSGVVLTVGAQMVVDFKLPVGRAEQVVEVQGAVAEVETTSSTVSSLVDATQMRELPLNGRNLTQLILMAPGVQVSQSNALSFYGRGDSFSFAGQRPYGQAYLVDNTDVSNYFGRGTGSDVLGTSLGVDAIAEFETLTNTYSAQFGGNGAAINAVTKSGTNRFHGSAFEFLRNSAVDARNYFDPLSGPPPFKRNQYGGALGGPIKKDKLFFFVNYEGLRQSLGLTEIGFIPDANARQGLLPCQAAPDIACNPATNLANVGVAPGVAATLAIFPATSAVSTNGTGVVTIPQIANRVGSENYVLGRIDYRLSNNDNLFARFTMDRGNFTDPFNNTAILGYGDVEHSPNLYFTTEEHHNWNHWVNSAHLSYVRTNVNAANNTFYPALHFVNLWPGTGDGDVGIAGLSIIGPTQGNPVLFIQNKGALSDDVIWNKGAHAITFGLGVGWNTYLADNAYGVAGIYAFNSLEQFLENEPASYIGPDSPLLTWSRWFGQKSLTPYINDDWRITPRLTMNIGLRYGFLARPNCIDNNCYGVIGNPVTATGFAPTPHIFGSNPASRNFDPRIGLAYDPFNDHKTSIRAGFGIFHDLILPYIYTPGIEENPYNVNISVWLPFLPPSEWPTYPVPTLTPQDQSVGSYLGYNTDTTPYSEQWNINVQRELPGGAVVQVGYLGSHGVHLFMENDANPYWYTIKNGVLTVDLPRPNPNFPGGMIYIFPSAGSSYNSMLVSLTRQIGHNWQLQANYTYAKCTDLVDGVEAIQSNGWPVTDPFNPQADLGPCGFVSTHVLHANAVGTLPFHGNRWVEGWELSAIATANSGLPFSPLVGYDNVFGGSEASERPNMVPGYTCNSRLVTGNPNYWFNTAPFSIPPSGTFGNNMAPRNCLVGPALFEPDFSISKMTRISERVQVQFRAEFFDIFNHTNFAMPGTAVGSIDAPYNNIFTQPPPGSNACYNMPGNASNPCLSPSAGVITTTATTSRQIQFGLKFVF